LSVAVVKHDAHGFHVDTSGKDSDRIFIAGMDVSLQGPTEGIWRQHCREGDDPAAVLLALAAQYDLVLIEGYKQLPAAKVWLLCEGEKAVPTEVGPVLDVLAPGVDRVARLMAILDEWLPRQWLRTPVFGCVLIGGKSSRLGQPKHLLGRLDRTWLDTAVDALRAVAKQVVIVGAGEVPERLRTLERLPDAPDTAGPLAGLLAAMRWAPWASWLVAACDMPHLSVEALHWLLATRTPGNWATVPRLAPDAPLEPLLAHYDFRARSLLERQAARGDYRIAGIATCPKVSTPQVPAPLACAWHDVDTRDDLEAMGLSSPIPFSEDR